MSNFRRAVHRRDRNCLVTHYNRCECEVCHIIPRTICKKYAPQFTYSPHNGLYMSSSIHTLYDQFVWTFDIYDVKYDATTMEYSMAVIANAHCKNTSIQPFVGQYIQVPIESYPFLYIHYQIFTIYNYEQTDNREHIYQELLEEDRVFNYLVNNPLPVDHILSHTMGQHLINQGQLDHPSDTDHQYINTILKRHNNEYLVWWDYLPQSEASWEPVECLTEQSLRNWKKKRSSSSSSSPPPSKRRRLQ